MEANFFRFFFYAEYDLFIQTREPNDFMNLDRVHFLNDEFTVHEDSFRHFQPHSFIVLDDFSFKKANNKQEKANFMKVVNYNLRHQNITLVLIVHNMYNNNLTSEIMLAPHLFLAYSNLGYDVMRYFSLSLPPPPPPHPNKLIFSVRGVRFSPCKWRWSKGVEGGGGAADIFIFSAKSSI